MIEVYLVGEVRAKGRPRFVRATGRTYTPKQTVSYESALRLAAQVAMVGQRVFECAVKVHVDVRVAIPDSFSAKKRAAALDGSLYPTKRPDIDNYLKSPLDAFNGIVWLDDKQVVEAHVRKRYAVLAGLHVTVRDAS